MPRPQSAPRPSVSPVPSVGPVVSGMVYCVIAALGYGAVNVCLRVLTVRCDRSLILFSKELMAFTCVAAWVILGLRRGRFALPGWPTALALMTVGILTQLVATLPFLWAMAVIGLAIAVTISLGMSLVTSAVLGRFVLGEKVSLQSLTSIGLLVGSVALMTFGVQSPALPSADSPTSFTLALAVAVACTAGMIYGLLNVSIRRSVTAGVSPGFVAMIIPLTGVVCSAPGCFGRLGVGGVLATPAADVGVMLVAGILNVIAWFSFIKGLQTTPVLHANVITASQVAIAAVAGIVLFEEAASPALFAGIAMTIAGMAWIDRAPAG